MFDKSLQYSVAAQKRQRHRLLRIVFTALAILLVYNAASAFLISAWVVQGDSMQPNFRSGDRLLVLSSAIPSLLSGSDIPHARGSVVLVDKSRVGGRNPFAVAADALIRFVTAQRVGLPGREGVRMKRIVALPGDEVTMSGFVMRIRPAGTPFALTEFELADRPYDADIPQLPAIWGSGLPFSGVMPPVALAAGEIFVVSDDRASTDDSRSWGPVDSGAVVGRPVFRFWPPSRIGFP